MTAPATPNYTRPGGTAAWAALTVALAAIVSGLVATVTGPGGHSLAAGFIGLAAGTTTLTLLGIAWLRNARAGQAARIAMDVLASSDIGHVVAHRDGVLVVANATARSLLGDRYSDLTILDTLFGVDGETREQLGRLRRAAAAGTAVVLELPQVDADGKRRWWRVSVLPLTDWPDHAHWRFQDITAEREMESVLRDQHARLTDFMDHAPLGFYSVDQDGRFLFANATLADLLGVETSDLMEEGVRLHDFLAEPPAGAAAYSVTAVDEESSKVDVALRSRRGQTVTVSILQTVMRGRDGSLWTRSLVRDLGPEQHMREALRASEMRFQRFFDDAPIGIALVDHETRLTEWNRTFTRLVGEDAGELAGQPVTSVLEENNPGLIENRLGAVIQGAKIESPLELRIRGRRELIVSMFAQSLDGGPGEQPGLILQFIDQTEQRKLESQFARSHKMQAVGQLAGGIAHDFNNLLTAMIGFCDLLLLRHKPGDASFGDIMQIKQNANRAANLVRQLLAFSRQQTLQPKVLNITDALAELSNLLRRLIGENIELKMQHGRDLGLVKVDQGQLEQVIINMAVNARDAMPGGGRLTIATGNVTLTEPIRRGTEDIPPGQYVSIDVRDTGVGIPPEIIDRIFDPFFSTKEVGSGTGLGLSTVYGIVRQTGGYISVDSTLGNGATFVIYLPRHIADVAPEPPAATREAVRDLTGVGRILLVEDEDPVRVFSARALRNKGYEVLEARSGDQALEHLAADERGIDLLVTDVVMPKMDGPTLIRRVREMRPNIDVICISGYAEDRFRQDIDDAAAIHFLAKPFSLKQLAAKVKDVMGAAEDPNSATRTDVERV